MNPVKTIYIYHDCFVVKTPECVLIFDFWKDPYQSGSLPNPLIDVDKEMPIYVFVSHFHKDHFNPVIFEWSRHFSDIRYIVSRDVKKRIKHILSPTSVYKGTKVAPELVTVLGDDDSFKDERIRVRSFPSTDIGNSYSVEVSGRTLFHAGDLNAWIWKDESTEAEVSSALKAYTTILGKIATEYPRFDICFFPVDSRIGTDYFTGARLFLERIVVDNFFPMHYELWEDDAERAQRHIDAAAFSCYASPTCHHYIMSAPYSAYTLT